MEQVVVRRAPSIKNANGYLPALSPIEIKTLVAEMLMPWGGMKAFVPPGASVLIKPNLCDPQPASSGVTTHLEVIQAVAELCREAGAAKITIGEGPIIGVDWQKVYEVTNLKRLEETGCQVINLHDYPTVTLDVPGGEIMKKVKISQPAWEADVVINIPVLKNHILTLLTCAMKNLKGVLPLSMKKQFHFRGLDGAIVDLNQVVRPALNIVDGIVGQEGLGPVSGTPAGLGVMLAGVNTVAVDAVAAAIIGYTPSEINHLLLASQRGLGPIDLRDIEVTGEPLAQVRREYHRPEVAGEFPGVTVVEGRACSGCSGSLFLSLTRMKKNGDLEKLLEQFQGVTFIKGLETELPITRKDGELVIALGNCQRKNRDKADLFIPGCSPQGWLIQDYIRKYILHLPATYATEDMLEGDIPEEDYEQN